MLGNKIISIINCEFYPIQLTVNVKATVKCQHGQKSLYCTAHLIQTKHVPENFRQGGHLVNNREVVDHQGDIILLTPEGEYLKYFCLEKKIFYLASAVAWPSRPRLEISVAAWALYLCINSAAVLDRQNSLQKL